MFETDNSSYMVRNSAILRKVAKEMEMKWKWGKEERKRRDSSK
jgi:hypothetical protein